jgi:hypothetical protein
MARHIFDVYPRCPLSSSVTARFRSEGTIPDIPVMDELYLDPASLTYKAAHQTQQIRELQKKLKEKEKKRVSDLKIIIGYYLAVKKAPLTEAIS